MMLAGGCGLNLDLSKISFLKESNNLFSEELGMLFQINKKDFSEFKKDLVKLGLKNSFFNIGSTNNTNNLFIIIFSSQNESQLFLLINFYNYNFQNYSSPLGL